MTGCQRGITLILSSLVWGSIGFSPALAQVPFNSGSTGVLGALTPTSNTAIALPPDGVLNYTTVNIPAGVTLTFTPNASNTRVTLLASGDVTIAGTVSVNGFDGVPQSTSGPTLNLGALGGPGGFSGGNGGQRGTNDSGTTGQGPGGGPGCGSSTCNNAPQGHGTYGADLSFVSLVPLFGGSGGGGTRANSTSGQTIAGGSGGGGGGAIVIASSTQITISGAVTANGGKGGMLGANCSFNTVAGSGSGGAIRLVAPQILGAGTLQATPGIQPSCFYNLSNSGRIRVEANTLSFTGTSTPGLSPGAPTGVTVASVPPLISAPSLRIASIAGVAMPPVPIGSATTPDVTLPVGTGNLVPVVLTANNIPVPTLFTVQVHVPTTSSPMVTVTSGASSGSFASSTATANVTLAPSQVSVLIVYANFNIPPTIARLLPLIDGEEVDHVMMAAELGETSSASLVTKHGKKVDLDQLSRENQLRVATAFEALQHAEN
ncbi:MAG: hypothetical protein GDA66_13630 [Nitrospira sp. CR1.2]|nr:hypothetical protein [Nitrospira sp. CR1.2]